LTTLVASILFFRLGGDAPAAKSYDTESNIHAKVELTFLLDNGTTYKKTATAGDTVAQVKKALSDVSGIPYVDLTLTLDGKTMMDPLSLNDLPAARGKQELQIHVKVAVH
jgi:hypothetical protein